MPAIVQFVRLWQEIQAKPPLSGDTDTFRWRLAANGKYSAKSAYLGFFLGEIRADYAELLWGSWAPLKEKTFSLVGDQKQVLDRCKVDNKRDAWP